MENNQKAGLNRRSVLGGAAAAAGALGATAVAVTRGGGARGRSRPRARSPGVRPHRWLRAVDGPGRRRPRRRRRARQGRPDRRGRAGPPRAGGPHRRPRHDRDARPGRHALAPVDHAVPVDVELVAGHGVLRAQRHQRRPRVALRPLPGRPARAGRRPQQRRHDRQRLVAQPALARPRRRQPPGPPRDRAAGAVLLRHPAGLSRDLGDRPRRHRAGQAGVVRQRAAAADAPRPGRASSGPGR